MLDAYTFAQIAAALGVTVDAVRKRASRGAWPYGARKDGRVTAHVLDYARLPKDVQFALVRQRRREQECEAAAKAAADTKAQRRITAALAEYPYAKGWRKTEAEKRCDALIEVRRLRLQGVSLRQARIRVAARLKAEGEPGTSVDSLKRWARLVKGIVHNHWLAFLLPDEKGRPPKAQIHPAAMAAFRQDWMRNEQPTAESCHRNLARRATVNPDWLPLPSVDTFMRRLKKEIPATQIVYAREGEEALMRFAPPVRRDRGALAALEIVDSDGHRFDVSVRYPDGSEGRPVVVAWQDVASGKVLSWRVGKSETGELVRLSYCDMVARYGIPGRAELDNGRAFASKGNTGGVPTRYRYKVRADDPKGVITRLGTHIHFVRPSNGKAKPIERAWRDIAGTVAKRQELGGAYLGSSPTTKPANYGRRSIDWDTFIAIVDDGFAEHNARAGRTGGICEGRSLDQTFADLYAVAKITKATETQLAMMLLASDVVGVSPTHGHVTLAGNRYWSEALCEHAGEKVELRFDPANLHAAVHAFQLDGTYIGKVDCSALTGHVTSEGAANVARTQKAYLKARKVAEKARKARDAAADPQPLPPIPEAVLPPPAATALFFPKSKTPPTPTLAVDETTSEFDALYTAKILQMNRNAL